MTIASEYGDASRHLGEQLRDAIEALSDGFALFDEDNRLVLCNARYRALNPAIAALIVPDVRWELLVHEAAAHGALSDDDRDALYRMESHLADEHAAVQALEIEQPNGDVHSLSMRPTPRGGFVLIHADVTARRTYEQTTREADLLLRKVLEACPANVVMSRIGDGQVIYRSPAATELLGTARNSHEHFASREARADFITALLPNGRVDDMPTTCLRPDGTPFSCTISARVIEYRGEDVVVSSTVDRSGEIAMQEELAAQRETIFQNEKLSALGELLAGVAHELNNPLSVVVGHALMLRDEATDPALLRRIDKIGQAAERCAKIVKTFLALARQQPSQLRPTDLNAAAGAAVELARLAPDAKGIAITTALAEALPAVVADADQITQVLINLITNAQQAIRASGRGDTIHIASRLDAASRSVEIRIGDNGPGIPEAIRSRIFDPFFTTKAVGQGTGIGLAFCHRIAVSHNGRIRLESGQPGRTSFVLRLPAADGAASPAPPREDARPPMRRASLLVVEDEADVAELIREILARDDIDVTHATSGAHALELLASHHYGLILSDLNMPGIDGRQLYERIASEHPQLVPRIGFVTGDTMSPTARAFLDTAGRPYLEKPIAPSELRALVRRLLAAGETGSRAG
ncbi:MAG TPA: response regulator [Rhodocyclaceae bacterium]|nr:response regulator [Rhodocyclaceae bacterium]